jgi:hypothetical protein|tara:strand:- start:477 stop:731 length:255 start_codon:yes stop_codon:yes gene_type:complete
MIDWVELNGTHGGYPVKVITYWEGRAKDTSIKIAWITRLSNELWHLTISNKIKFMPDNNFREKDVDKLKNIMETIYKEMINKLK